MKSKKKYLDRLIAFVMIFAMVVNGTVFSVGATSFTPAYVSAYEGTPTATGVGYTAAEVSVQSNKLISGQRVKVTAPFDGFQIYMANWNTYHFTLSVYEWTNNYESTIATTPLKTVAKTMTHGAVQAESLTWTDGELPAGEYLFVVEKPMDRNNVAARLGVAGVSSNVSKGEFYRLGSVVADMELALDIRFTKEAPAGGYFASLTSFEATYVPAYDGKPTGNTYTVDEVSGKNPADIISGQRVSVTAPFDGFQIYMANGNAYHFTLSVYKWTDDYATTIATTPLKTKSMTLTNGAVQPKEFKWTDGALEAGEYFFVVENAKSKDSVTNNPNRLGLAEVASNVSKGEYYRVGKLTTGKELALDIHFTQEAPAGGYFGTAFEATYVPAYDGKPTGNTYTVAEVSGKNPADIISGQRIRVTAPFDGFQIYMANGNAYNFTLSVYKWTDDYATTIAAAPLKTVDKTTTSGAVRAESITWTDGALEPGVYFFVVENAKSKSTVTNNPNRLGLAEVASDVSKGEYYRVGKLTSGKELALDIHFTQEAPEGGYFASLFEATYVPAYDGKPTGNTYTVAEVSGKKPEDMVSGQRVKVTAPFDGFQIYMANGNVYNFTLSVYKWNEDFNTTIKGTPLKTIDKTMTHGNVQPEGLTWTDGALEAGEYLFVVENAKSKSTVTNNPNRLGLAEVASNVSKGEYYRIGKLTNDKELGLDIHFTAAAPAQGYFEEVASRFYAPAYDEDAELADKEMGCSVGGSLGERVRVNASFDGFRFYILDYTCTSVEFSVYAWDETFEETVAQTPLVTKELTSTNALGNGWIEVTHDKLPAGEYLFLVHNQKKNGEVYKIGVSHTKVSDDPYTMVFKDGSETTTDLRFGIYFTENIDDGYYAPLSEAAFVMAYNPDATESHEWTAKGGAMGQRINVGSEFRGFSVSIGRGRSEYVTLAIYKWDKTVSNTTSKEPVLRRDVACVVENGFVTVMADEVLPAGEYYFAVEATNEGVSVWSKLNSNTSKGLAYINGTEKQTELKIKIFFPKSPATPFKELSTGAYVKAYEQDAEEARLYSATAGGEMGQRLVVNGSFSAVKFFVGRLKSTKLDISIYKWNKNYKTTVSAKPLFSKTCELTLANGYVEAMMDKELPGGDYLFLISNSDSAITLFGRATNNVSGGYAYDKGAQKEMELNMQLYFDNPPSKPFSPVTTDLYQDAYIRGEASTNLWTPEGGYIAKHVKINTGFSGVRFLIGRLKSSELDFSVYTWYKTVDQTLAKEPIISKRCYITEENGWVEADYGTIIPAGEYLIVAENADSRFAIWGVKNNDVTNAPSFANGVTSNLDLSMSFFVSEKVPNMFGTVSPKYVYTDVGITDPAAYSNYMRINPVTKKIGQRLNINRSFDGVAFQLPTFYNTNCKVSISAYEWAGSYEETIKQKAIKTVRVETVRDNGWHWFFFDEEQEAGDYLFLLHDPEGIFGVYYSVGNEVAKGSCYVDGAEIRNTCNVRVRCSGTVDTSFRNVHTGTKIFNHTEDVHMSSFSISGDDNKYGMRMKLDKPIVGLEFRLANMTIADRIVYYCVYDWKGSYDASINEKPIRKIEVKWGDEWNPTVTKDFDEPLEAGEYLILVESGADVVHYFATSAPPTMDATFYVNGTEMPGSMWMGVIYDVSAYKTPFDKALGYADKK